MEFDGTERDGKVAESGRNGQAFAIVEEKPVRMGIIPITLDFIRVLLHPPEDVMVVGIEVRELPFDCRYPIGQQVLRIKVKTTNPEYTVFPIVQEGECLLETPLVYKVLRSGDDRHSDDFYPCLNEVKEVIGK